MAHILVYLQRTPWGLHPASAVSLCLGRDIGSHKGASVTGICLGDAGAVDEAVAKAAGRFGCDQVMIGGRSTLANLVERLRPAHILVPHTPEGMAVAADLAGGPAVPRLVDAPQPDFGGADAVSAIIAGTWPWFSLSAEIDPEYGGDVAESAVPAWVKDAGEEPPVFLGTRGAPIRYVAPQDLDAATVSALEALGATAVPLDEASALQSGTLLWFDAGPSGLPPQLGQRDPNASVVLLPGPSASFQDSWALADWVLPGPWADVVAHLREAPWTTALR